MRTDKLKVSAAVLDWEDQGRQNWALLPPAHRWWEEECPGGGIPGKMDCFYQVRPPKEGVGVPRALAWNLGSPMTPVWHLLSSARLDPGDRWAKEARRLCQGWEGGWAEISSIRKCGRDKRCVCAVFAGRSLNRGLAFHKQPLGKDLVNLLRRA